MMEESSTSFLNFPNGRLILTVQKNKFLKFGFYLSTHTSHARTMSSHEEQIKKAQKLKSEGKKKVILLPGNGGGDITYSMW